MGDDDDREDSGIDALGELGRRIIAVGVSQDPGQGKPDGQQAKPGPSAMLAAHELIPPLPYPYELTARQTADALAQTRRFTEWLLSWDEPLTWLIPPCWDAHPMLYRMMEALRLSHAETALSRGGEIAWQLKCLYPMTQQIRDYTSEYGLTKPHSHSERPPADMRAGARVEWYRAHGDPGFPDGPEADGTQEPAD